MMARVLRGAAVVATVPFFWLACVVSVPCVLVSSAVAVQAFEVVAWPFLHALEAWTVSK
jgi:hypothetical protein